MMQEAPAVQFRAQAGDWVVSNRQETQCSAGLPCCRAFPHLQGSGHTASADSRTTVHGGPATVIILSYQIPRTIKTSVQQTE